MLPMQIQERIQNMTSIEVGPPAAAANAAGRVGEEDQGSGYGNTQRNAIDQMIEHVGRAAAGSANRAAGAKDRTQSVVKRAIDHGHATRRARLDLDGDTLREECGVFGIFGHDDAAALTRSAFMRSSIAARRRPASSPSTAGASIPSAAWPGRRRLLERETDCQAEGPRAIDHVRYSTTGGTILRNVQPLFAELASGGFAVGHNGNFTNGLTLRRELVATGAICQSTSDTEVILHLVARSKPRIIDRFVDCLRQLEEPIRWSCSPTRR